MNDISQFLAHADSARTVWFTDFDGVLYRGMFPRWTQGISNAEFALAFWALHAAHPVRSLRILRGLVHIGRLRIRLYRGYRAGKCTLGETEYPLIRRFVERVLRPGLPEYILPAARWTVRFCDPDGLGTLGEVRGRGTAVVVLSKAFTPVLDAAASLSEDRSVLYVTLVNRHPRRALRVEWRGLPGGVSGRAVKISRIAGPEPWARNTFEGPDTVRLETRTILLREFLAAPLPPASVTGVSIPVAGTE